MNDEETPEGYLEAIDHAAMAPMDEVSGRSDRSGRGRRPDRKTLQLCRQVADTLNYVLTGEMDDDLLRNLYVVRVDPAPDVGQMMVTVAPMDPKDAGRSDQILTHLMHATKKLRTEIARSINRRKTPQLVFRVIVPPAAEGQSEGVRE